MSETQVYRIVRCTNAFFVSQLNPSAELDFSFFMLTVTFISTVWIYSRVKKRTMNPWTDKAGGFCCCCFVDFHF